MPVIFCDYFVTRLRFKYSQFSQGFVSLALGYLSIAPLGLICSRCAGIFFWIPHPFNIIQDRQVRDKVLSCGAASGFVVNSAATGRGIFYKRLIGST